MLPNVNLSDQAIDSTVWEIQGYPNCILSAETHTNRIPTPEPL